MMELLRTKATRTKVSEFVYIGLNALLPVAVLLLVRIEPPFLAFLLILLSKWRILALRPRFWWVNIKANLVDIVVGMSVVGLLYLSSSLFALQLLFTLGYALWLLVLKPKSTSRGILLQAGVAQFVGLVTLFHFSAVLPGVVVLLGSWVIGYVTARHVVSNYEEEYIEVISVIWGLVVAELAWLMYHWTAVYSLGLPINIPQIALVMLVVGFCASRIYDMEKHERLDSTVIRNTILFGSALLAVIMFFSPWDVTV